MNVYEFHKKLSELYPRTLSCEWDNDGIMCSADTDAEVRRVLVALDATDAVLKYAAKQDFDTVLVHHPLIFKPMKSIVSGSFPDDKVIFAINHRISVISMHTRFDAGTGGVNDVLASKIGLINAEPFGDDECPSAGRIGTLSREYCLTEYAEIIKTSLGCPSVTVTETGGGRVSKVALVSGAGKDYIALAASLGADTFVTGEASYNASIDAAQSDISIIEAGHYYTENPACKKLAELARDIAGANAEIYDCQMQKTI